MDLVSIIIPNFNKASFIKDTLDSILLQTSNDWEAIIVDDKSNDNSAEICKKYASEDNRIKFYLRDRFPKGANTCRNIGIKKAKGRYIIFLDSDDLMAPFCIEQRYKFMSQINNLDFIVFPIGNFNKKIGDSKFVWSPKKNANHLSLFLRHELPWHTSSPIWRKDFLLSNYGFNESYPRLQDVELHTRVLLNCEAKYSVSENVKPDCFYRTSIERTTQNQEDLISDFIKGVILYVRDMQILIKKSERNLKNSAILTKALKGTLFKAIRQILYYEQVNSISNEKSIRLIDDILSNDYTQKLSTPFNLKVINYYIDGYKKGLFRIKGYNFLGNFLFSKF